MMNPPQWKHDCNRCRFHGSHLLGAMVDVYACPDARGTLPGGSVIVRFSDDPPDYWSAPRAMLDAMPGETAGLARRVIA